MADLTKGVGIVQCMNETVSGVSHNSFWAFLVGTIIGTVLLAVREVKELFGIRNKRIDPGRIRTCNLLIRSQTRYPLRHWANYAIAKNLNDINLGQKMLNICGKEELNPAIYLIDIDIWL